MPAVSTKRGLWHYAGFVWQTLEQYVCYCWPSGVLSDGCAGKARTLAPTLNLWASGNPWISRTSTLWGGESKSRMQSHTSSRAGPVTLRSSCANAGTVTAAGRGCGQALLAVRVLWLAGLPVLQVCIVGSHPHGARTFVAAHG